MIEEICDRGNLRRGKVWSGNCSVGKCPLVECTSRKCRSDVCPRRSVSRGTVQLRNCPAIDKFLQYFEQFP